MAGELYTQPIGQPKELAKVLREKLRSPGPVAIFIAGPMGSGKNHLANKLLTYAQHSSMPETADEDGLKFL